jgi:putative FmdB family regulatory protein
VDEDEAMPIYEYLCKGCGHEFEREQRITDKPVRTCPRCKARKVQRLISQTSFVLKGGGWYSDLYSTPKAKKEAGDAAEKPAAESSDKPDKGGDGAPKPDGGSKGKKSKGKKAAAA